LRTPVKNTARIVFPLLVSLSLGYLLLGRHGLDEIQKLLADASPSSLAIYPIFWLASSMARAAIYSFLLDRRVPWRELIPLMWVRSFAVDLLPARGGLAAIPAALKLIWQIPVSSGVATLVGATVVEFATLGIVILLALGLSVESLPQDQMRILFLLGICLILALPVSLLIFGRLGGLNRNSRESSALRGTAKTVENSGSNGRGKLVTIVRRISQDAYTLKQGGKLVPVLGLTFLTRVFKYGGLYLLFRAIVPTGLSPVLFLTAMIAAEATSSLPIQGLAGIGTWEAAWIAASTAFGLDHRLAVSSGFGLHLLVLCWEIFSGSVGLVFLARTRRKRLT